MSLRLVGPSWDASCIAFLDLLRGFSRVPPEPARRTRLLRGVYRRMIEAICPPISPQPLHLVQGDGSRCPRSRDFAFSTHVRHASGLTVARTVSVEDADIPDVQICESTQTGVESLAQFNACGSSFVHRRCCCTEGPARSLARSGARGPPPT